MRIIDSDLFDDILAGDIARLVKVTYKNGTTHGFTDHDEQLTVDGQDYIPAPGLQALRYVATSDVEVSAQEVGSGWVEIPQEDISSGLVDGAEIEASWCGWEHPENGRMVVFLGKVDTITYEDGGFKAEIMSFMKQLEKQLGSTYTSTCRHKLFGTDGPGKIGACGLSSGAFTFTGAVDTIVSSKWKFTVTGLSNPDGYFDNALLTFTSGLNNGLSVQVKTYGSSTISLFLRSMMNIAPGDTFSIQAGCDKTAETCKTKFNNIVNFGGFPHINPNINYR